jgi:hypothetical protein
MDEAPEIPAPLPELPRKKLWTVLAIPPVIMTVGTVIMSMIFGSKNYGAEMLWMLPAGLIAIITCLVFFIRAFRVRYHGRTLVLTAIGYFLGEVIVCLCLWFGSCVVVLQ